MNEEEHTLAIQHAYAIGAKRKVIEFKHMLTDEDIVEIVNALVTFENSHKVAKGFNDAQVAYALMQELQVQR